MKNIFFAILMIATFTVIAQNGKIAILSPADFNQKIKTEKGIILDVRTPGEFKKGHLKGARLLDIFSDAFETEINKMDKNTTYYVYCQSGGRSGEATELMHKKGFKVVYDLDGGFGRWKSQNLPFEQ
ncbi:MAG: rhodanese-like domain-containing protein [Bacteroidota bacterium]